jgi:hypothetical protein
VLCVPLAALLPVQSPLAVHDVGLFVELQVKVALPPTVVEIGLIDTFTVGADGNVTLTLMLLAKPVPPALVHDRL